MTMSARANGSLALMALLLQVGCGDELGPCDDAAASQLVYAESGLIATKGQALVHDSCGGTSFCHASQAKGEARFGVPQGLNFDMLPAATGWPSVIEHRNEIWEAVLDGSMPPEGEGQRPLMRGNWSFDPYRADGAAVLAPLTSNEGKAALRNWLACGAPVVGQTRAPAWLTPDPGQVDLTDWQGIYGSIIAPQCATAGCHNSAAAGGLVLADACDSYRTLTAPGSCGEMAALTPGENAPFLDKLESKNPMCGGQRMPPSGPLPDKQLEAIRLWIEAGAPAASCP